VYHFADFEIKLACERPTEVLFSPVTPFIHRDLRIPITLNHFPLPQRLRLRLRPRAEPIGLPVLVC
jgi:hypothetical protein